MTTNPYNGIPNKVYGFEEGASSPRQSALVYGDNMVETQNLLNNTHGGSKYYKKQFKKFKKQKKMNGGELLTGKIPSNQIAVPSFNPPGPQVSPFDANSSSKQGNQTFVNTLASGCNDCYVNNSCDTTPGCPPPVSGGSRKYISNKPFSIEIERVKISPFKNSNSVKNTLKKWKKNKKSIGFTAKSSLKSMGLIPRSSGKYELGNKYIKLTLSSNKKKNKKNKTRKNKYSKKY